MGEEDKFRLAYTHVECLFQSAVPLLVGTKYDEFVNLAYEDQDEITRQVHNKDK